MVRVYGANLSDITDRPARGIGTPSGNWLSHLTTPMPLNMTENLSLAVQVRPWWAYHAPGREMHIDDFEGTLGWRQTAGTATKASEATHVHQGNSALKLVTGIVAGNSAIADWWGPEVITYIHEQYVVLSFWWQLQGGNDLTCRDIFFKLHISTAIKNQEYVFGMRYQHFNGGVLSPAWQCWHSTGSWFPVLSTPAKWTVLPMWNHWQVAITWPTSNTAPSYRWFWFNSQTAVKSVQAPHVLGYSRPGTQIEIGCTTDAAEATTAYIDDLSYMDECGWTDF